MTVCKETNMYNAGKDPTERRKETDYVRVSREFGTFQQYRRYFERDWGGSS